MLDLRQLRYFVAVAEAQNVTRAGERLRISQSPLSRQIRQLEAQLGLELFHRSRQRVQLTAAGRDFLTEARLLLEQAAAVEARARAAARSDKDNLVLGFVDGAFHAGFLPASLREARRRQSGLRIELRSLRSAAQVAALRNGELDIGYVYTAPERPGDLICELVLDEPFRLAVSRDHPLARRQRVTVEDLQREAFIGLPESTAPEARHEFLRACGEIGLQPDIRSETTEMIVALGLVQAGLGVAVVQAGAAKLAIPHIQLLEMPRGFSQRLKIWRITPKRPSAAAKRFLAGATERVIRA